MPTPLETAQSYYRAYPQARADAAYHKAEAVRLNQKEQAVSTELHSHKFSAALAAPK